MSSTVSLIPPRPSQERASAGERTHDRRASLARLTAVELRKMVNTRSGFWVPIAVAAVMFVVALVSAANHGGRGGTFAHVFHDTLLPGQILLPVMGILLVCGEWSQRTTLTTFTLVPARRRVFAAKLGASVAVCVAALAASLAFTLVCASLFGHAPGGTGSLSGTVIAQGGLFLLIGMLTGLAFGVAILTTAPAIVVYLVLPTVWDAAAGGIHWLASVARWLDGSKTLVPLTEGALTATQWAHVATTLALWVGVPALIGWWRIRRRDV